MESRPSKKPNESLTRPESSSRRKFLQKLGLVGAGMVIGKGITESLTNSNESPESPAKSPEKKAPDTHKPESVPVVESITKEPVTEIDNDLAVIESRDYEKYFSRPYLIYALYYSDKGMQEMTEAKNKTPQQEKIAKLHQLITPQLRDGYLAYLEKLYENEIFTQTEVPPLKDLGISARLDTNHLDAIDIFTEEGSVVESFTDGVVVLAENSWDKDDILSTSSARGGNTVIIYNPKKKEFYRYAHLKEVTPKPGTLIRAKEPIARVGNSGLTASRPGHGKHLHFEINSYDPETKIMTALSVYELRDRLLAAKSNLNN